jgi:hypothetical protein
MSTTTDERTAARQVIASAQFVTFVPHLADWLDGFVAQFTVDDTTLRINRAITPNLDETMVDVLTGDRWKAYLGEYADLDITNRPTLPHALAAPGVLLAVIEELDAGAVEMRGRIDNFIGELADSILTDIAEKED